MLALGTEAPQDSMETGLGGENSGLSPKHDLGSGQMASTPYLLTLPHTTASAPAAAPTAPTA